MSSFSGAGRAPLRASSRPIDRSGPASSRRPREMAPFLRRQRPPSRRSQRVGPTTDPPRTTW
eukprot:5839585-Lingulodinium_polyedra.AAC.1